MFLYTRDLDEINRLTKYCTIMKLSWKIEYHQPKNSFYIEVVEPKKGGAKFKRDSTNLNYDLSKVIDEIIEWNKKEKAKEQSNE